MTHRRQRFFGIAVLVLAGCDRFGNNAQGGGQTPPSGFGGQGAMGQQLPQGQQFPPSPQGLPVPGAQPNLNQLETWERQDAGVQATNQLHNGPMHGPTPNQIPGGQVITTKGLLPLLQGGAGVPVLVLDVLGNPQGQLPNAAPAAFAAQPGDFNDAVQQQLGQMLMQITQGNKQIPIVTYCQGPQCWMSYNAALRAIALGYTNVLWYRGGLEAWQQATSQMAGVGGQPPAMNGPQAPAQPGVYGGSNRE
jgi:PQQ-dependent catabolism-associated CXXCW motif protein